MLVKSELIGIRDSNPGDINFILATWLRGLKYGNDWFQMIDPDIYFSIYQSAIEAILAKPNITVKVACLKDDPEVVVGYAVYANQRLDWVFVKKAWRGIGIAKSLIPDDIKTVSHITAVGKKILHKHQGVKFNPFSFN